MEARWVVSEMLLFCLPRKPLESEVSIVNFALPGRAAENELWEPGAFKKPLLLLLELVEVVVVVVVLRKDGMSGTGGAVDVFLERGSPPIGTVPEPRDDPPALVTSAEAEDER